MKNDLYKIMRQMACLLKEGEQLQWAKILLRLSNEIDNDYLELKFKIKSLYGGMGSLNDVVLFQKNQPLKKENQEFDKLRSKLFDLIN